MEKRTGIGAAILAAIAAIALFPGEAWAWGAGIHISQGSFVLENLSLIRPQIASILSAYPMDYLYGCISADIFIGKGSQRKPDHCHNWSVGMKTLKGSSDNSTKAYAYGYLTHLAADVIAHNYFIPKLLCVTPGANGIGHVYWEFRADRYIRKKHWKTASQVVSKHNHDNDTLIKRVMKRSRLRFGAKKMVFKRAVRMQDIIVWREHVESVIARQRRINRRMVSTYNNYSVNLILDLLINEDSAACLEYDPVGTDNMNNARLIRRHKQKEFKHQAMETMFETPDRLTEVRHVDHETERF